MNDKKYLSKYSNGTLVSGAQFITEIICERIAKRTKKDLHYRFWLSATWAKEYKGQIGAAHKLLKKYDVTDIVQALNTSSGQKIYSLRAPHLSGIIDRYVLHKTTQTSTSSSDHTKTNSRNLLESGIQKQKTKSIIDKLKELE